MTVSILTVKNSYTSDGVQTEWDYTFPIVLSADLKLYDLDLNGVETLITSNYTIDTLNSRIIYPSVASLLPPIEAGHTITVARSQSPTQLYTGALTPAVVEAALDKLTMLVQEDREALSRCIQFEISQTPVATTVSSLLAAATQAAASAAAAAASAAGLHLPSISIADAGKVLQVNGAGSGYQTASMLTNPLTTNGDIIYGVGATPTRLAKGTANQVLHSGNVPSWSAVVEADITLADNTTNNVTSTKHGFAPKSPADATKFLNGAATSAWAAVKDSDLSTSDITTNDVSTTKHGFAPKAPNDPTKFLDGMGAYSVPTFIGPGRLLRVTVFAASGTWTKGIGCNMVVCEVVGGGGNGGDGGSPGTAIGYSGGGGGGGGYSKRIVTSPGTTETVTVGAAGGTSSFGLWASATGGSNGTNNGGSNSTNYAGGAGGTGSGGDINLTGQPGTAGFNSASIGSTGLSAGGKGGDAPMGFGYGAPSPGIDLNGAAGGSYGGGGSGGNNTGKTGGAGAGGVVVVWEFS